MLAPLSRPRRLDLERSADEPLAPEEVTEASEHLLFLRQFKGLLRLSLNAAEDLLVNGAKAPSERGVIKHLLSKVDRKLVERTLAREALEKDPALRARFLAGVVRLNPEVSVLLWYLESLAGIADRRDAAAAFALTTDRIDFASLSQAQLASLLDLTTRTFAGHDRVQAVFGLLSSETFAAALDRAAPQLSSEHRALILPLRAAHRAVLLGGPLPADEDTRELLERGVAMVLEAPDRVIRSYPAQIRARLAELVIREQDLSAHGVPRSLLDSLPHQEEIYARLALARAEQLLRAHDDQGARALTSQLVQSHPELSRAAQLHEALGWRKVGRVTIAPEATTASRAAAGGPGEARGGRRSPEPAPGAAEGGPDAPDAPGAREPAGPRAHGSAEPPRLLRAFWLDGPCSVWARLAPPEEAGRLALEAQIQETLLLPGVLPGLAHGVGADGTAFAAIAPGGRLLDAALAAKQTLHDAILLALEATRILSGLALAGVELPSAELGRFVLERGGPHGLRLADLSGASRRDTGAAMITHGRLAIDFCRAVFATQSEVPKVIRARLRGAAPLVILARVLLDEVAKRAEA